MRRATGEGNKLSIIRHVHTGDPDSVVVSGPDRVDIIKFYSCPKSTIYWTLAGGSNGNTGKL